MTTKEFTFESEVGGFDYCLLIHAEADVTYRDSEYDIEDVRIIRCEDINDNNISLSPEDRTKAASEALDCAYKWLPVWEQEIEGYWDELALEARFEEMMEQTKKEVTI